MNDKGLHSFTGKRKQPIPREVLAKLYLYVTEEPFLAMGKKIEAEFRGKIPDDALNTIHAELLVGRMEEVAAILGEPKP